MACMITKLFLLILSVTVATAADTVDCGGEGWSYYPPTGFCYGANINLQRNTWTKAEAYCTQNGGHLVTINSLDEYQQFVSYVFTAWEGLYGNWVGYYTETGTAFDQTKWKSVDGTVVDISKYAPWCNEARWGGMYKRGSGRRCLGFGWDQQKMCFYDLDCDEGGRFATLKVICKRPPKSGAKSNLSPAIVSTEKHDCGGDGWSYYPSTGYCYGANIQLERATFTNAERYCKENAGHLVTIDSEIEYQHLLSYIFLGWDNVYGNWIGYFTKYGSNSDPSKWIATDGSHSESLKYGKWCNEHRWGGTAPKVSGKRCLGMGWDQQKICYYDVDCDAGGQQATLKVICKRSPNTFPKNTSLPGLVPSAVDCGGEGWSYYPATGYCYGADVELQRNTWTKAEAYCTAHGGHLLTINSLEEYQQFVSYVFTAWEGLYGNWVGYYTETGTAFDQTKWKSVDGTTVDISKYAPWCNEARWGGMYKRGSGRRCLGFGWDQQKMCFYDLDCDEGGRFATLKVICKRSPKLIAKTPPPSILPAPVNCGGEGWSYYPPTGFCYGANIELQRNTFTNAEKYCKDNGGHLATIGNEDEYKHLLSYIFLAWDNLYGNWIGYYTESGTNFDPKNWISVDGSHSESLKYGKWCNEFRWGTQVPRVPGKRCLGIGWDQEKICYYDVDCDAGGRHATLKVICKRPPIKSQTKDDEQIPIVMEDSKTDPIPTASIAATTIRMSCFV